VNRRSELPHHSIPRKDQKFAYKQNVGVRIIVFNAFFNNFSVIPWGSVLLVEETGVLGENQRPAANSVCQDEKDIGKLFVYI
jgi:hypothetical protein